MLNRQIKKPATYENRLNFILAIIFLLGLALIYRLYELQIRQGSEYKNRAARQQQIESQLAPSRGQIYLNNYSQSLNKNELSVFATNKNFAVLYAVPKDFPSDLASSTANLLYDTFDRLGVEEQVDEFLAQQDREDLANELKYINNLSLSVAEKETKKAEVLQKRDALRQDPEWLEFRKIKRELEINDRRQALLSNYLNKLSKANDPYEVLEKKVSEEDLLKFYGTILQINPAELEVRNKLIYKKNDPNPQPDPLDIKGLSYEMTPYRYYPEKELGAQLLGFVNYENQGNYGLEEYFNDDLVGVSGYLKTDQGANRNTIIVNDREYVKPENGSDLVLTIDRSIQFQVCKKLAEAEGRYKFDQASIVIVTPQTGEVVAMCSWPAYDPNNYAEVKDQQLFKNDITSLQYEPGSVFKTITMAAALDKEKVKPETTYNDLGQITIPGWPKPIKNSDFDKVGGHGIVDMKTVLEKSLNTGAIFAMQQLGDTAFADYVKLFGFGEKTGISLSAEASGSIRSLLKDKIRPIDVATISFGQGIAVTPLQMVMSYAAIANKGILMKPYIVKEIIKSDGSKTVTKPEAVRRVISEKAAVTVSGMLAEVVEKGHSQKAGVSGYYVGGKTGTAQVPAKSGGYLEGQYIHTFVGFAPVDKPRFVMLVKLDHPKGFAFAESSAAPIFGELADFLLKYYQVPKERD